MKIDLWCIHCKRVVPGYGPSNGDGYVIDNHLDINGKEECIGSITSSRPATEYFMIFYPEEYFSIPENRN